MHVVVGDAFLTSHSMLSGWREELHANSLWRLYLLTEYHKAATSHQSPTY